MQVHFAMLLWTETSITDLSWRGNRSCKQRRNLCWNLKISTLAAGDSEHSLPAGCEILTSKGKRKNSDKTCLLFAGQGAQKLGWLVTCMQPIQLSRKPYTASQILGLWFTKIDWFWTKKSSIKTRHTWTGYLTTSVAIYRLLAVLNYTILWRLSLGEYLLIAAGALFLKKWLPWFKRALDRTAAPAGSGRW